MKKTKLLMPAAIVVIILSLLSVSFTLAYLTDNQNIKNTFTFGDVKVQLYETTSTSGMSLKPGSVVPMDPTVRNISDTPAYIRATVSVGQPGFKNQQTIFDFIQMGALGQGWVVAPADAAAGNQWNESQTITLLYTLPLEKNETTTPIFTQFTVSPYSMSSVFLQGANTDFNVSVDIDAVQTTDDEDALLTPQQAFALFDSL